MGRLGEIRWRDEEARCLAVLGLRPGASGEEVRRAYRQLARRWHPDRYTEAWQKERAAEKLRAVNLAHERLRRRRPPVRPNGPERSAPGRAPGPAAGAPRREPAIEDLVATARALVTWGRPPADVVSLLVGRGVRADLARSVVDGFLAERHASFRRKGMHDLTGAGGLLLVGTWFAWLVGASRMLQASVPIISAYLLMVCLLALSAGAWLLARGLGRLRDGGLGEGAETVRF